MFSAMAKGRLKVKAEYLRQCVLGRFHALMTRQLLSHIDYLEQAASDLDDQIDRLMIPFAEARDRFDTIPGIGKRNAEIIVAEIGIDMTQFPTPAHLASWAGLCPGNNESAGKHKSPKTRSGNPWLTSSLVEAGVVCGANQGLLPRRQVPTYRQTTRRSTRPDRDRAHDPGHLLVPPRR